MLHNTNVVSTKIKLFTTVLWRKDIMSYKITIREINNGTFLYSDDMRNESPIKLTYRSMLLRCRVIVATERNEYRLDVFRPDGTLDFVFTRPYKSWKRSSEEITRLKETAMPFRRRNHAAPEFVVEPTEKDILQVRTTADGNIWVLPSRGIREQPTGIHSTWDIFADDGNFVEQVAISCPGRGQKDALFFAGDDIVVLVREHADAMAAFRGGSSEDSDAEGFDEDAMPLEVICYQVRP